MFLRHLADVVEIFIRSFQGSVNRKNPLAETTRTTIKCLCNKKTLSLNKENTYIYQKFVKQFEKQ